MSGEKKYLSQGEKKRCKLPKEEMIVLSSCGEPYVERKSFERKEGGAISSFFAVEEKPLDRGRKGDSRYNLLSAKRSITTRS